MGIGRPPATDEARLLGDIFDMLSVANTTRCWQRECGFVDCGDSEMPFTRTNSGLMAIGQYMLACLRMEYHRCYSRLIAKFYVYPSFADETA
jgi:hypothetical protein